ncbi:MAG: hypothetical protein H0V70_25865 [Ktedonobacteraceae bacterium]|nr:hypothetical protein [Ktedonobacteraceae bacterium]
MVMDTTPIFYTTISSKELRPDMPPVPFLLSAASFLRQNSQGQCSLRAPRYLPASVLRGADCGGFTAVMRWGGEYRFTLDQYLLWLFRWHPQWAAAFDLPCLSETGGYPGPKVVEERQRWTTAKAWEIWEGYWDTPWAWTPTIQGYTLSEFEQHARDLTDLIRQMQAYYSDPGRSDDDEEEGCLNAFRVGVGSLCRRSPEFILEVITRIHAIIGADIPLHLWGVKLGQLKSGIALPGVISCDSGAWNGLYGKEHEKRRKSGLTVVEYSWQVKHPEYMCKVARAQHRSQQLGLAFVDAFGAGPFPDPIQLVEHFAQL